MLAVPSLPVMTEETPSGGLDRRSFLALGAAASGAVLMPTTPALAGRMTRSSGSVFRLGVASGDPLPDSVILWTRLAPKPLELDGGMGKATAKVEWEIARDEKFSKIAARGAVQATPKYGHSVHIDIRGLTPDSWYYYRFKHGREISPVGRTRTTPELGAAMSSLVVGQTSCANWQSGYYQLYADLAAQEPDYWLALGDYIYEYGNKGYLRTGQTKPTRSIPWSGEPFTLGEYRRQYGLYRRAQSLQDLHATAPYSVIWDDHEVDNNFTADKSGGDGQADKGRFLARRAAGFQAFWENHAIRVPTPAPNPSKMDIYRRVDWGSLASFLLLDGRQYRSDQAGDDTPQDFGKVVEGMFDADATILGQDQESWLASELAEGTSRWTFVAQQTVVSSLNGTAGLPGPFFPDVVAKGLFNYDAWDGYWAARGRLVEAITSGQVRNPIILTGDFHTNLTFNLLDAWPDPRDSSTPQEMTDAVANWRGNVIGTEICAGAISSPTFFGDPVLGLLAPGVRDRTPWLRYAEYDSNGYVLLTVSPESTEAKYRIADASVRPNKPGGKPRTDKTIVISDGVPGVSEVV